jgi:hypothetical protein
MSPTRRRPTASGRKLGDNWLPGACGIGYNRHCDPDALYRIFPATYLDRLMSRSCRRDPYPPVAMLSVAAGGVRCVALTPSLTATSIALNPLAGQKHDLVTATRFAAA